MSTFRYRAKSVSQEVLQSLIELGVVVKAHTPEEYIDRVGWGHSHYLFALRIAAEANVKRLYLFHHDPSHSDEKIDDINNSLKRVSKEEQGKYELILNKNHSSKELTYLFNLLS